MCDREPVLFAIGPASTILRPRLGWPWPWIFLESAVTSFLGVLGITIVLFFVVAGTARAILGR